MKNRTQWGIILALTAFSTLAFPPSTAAADDPAPLRERFDLLWSIEGTENRVYLLGAVHLVPQGAKGFPEVVTAAYRSSDLVVFESDLFLVGSVAYEADELSQARYPAGRRIHDEISPALMLKAETKAQNLGLPMSILERYRPWFFAQMLTTAQFAREGFPLDNGIDYRIYKDAVNDIKLTAGLSSPAEHLAVYADMTSEQNENFLRTALIDLEDTRAQVSRILDIYNNANLKLLTSLANEMKVQTPSLYQRLIADRNSAWMERIAEFREAKGNVLIVVGAMHLVGDDGLIQSFRERGWNPKVPKHRGFRPPE